MEACFTRSSTEHSIFGQPAKLPPKQLPTSEDVFRAYDYYFKGGQYTGVHEISTTIAKEVMEIYVIASIPTIQLSSVVARVKRLVAKIHELGKYPDTKKSSSTFKTKLHSFKCLFDVCCCKCFDSGARERSQCTCVISNKIPELEWNFWLDQKTERKMSIGKLDRKETLKLKKKYDRVNQKRGINKCGQEKKLKVEVDFGDIDTDHSSDGNESSSNEILNESSDEKNSFGRNMKQYPELCKAIDRCKVSNRDACLVANAVLKDLNLLSPDTAIDPAKLRRQRKLYRKAEASRHAEDVKKIICLGFDGKQDMTLVETGGIRRTVKEEHYVLVCYPENAYIDHVVPESSKASDVVKEIISVVIQTDSTLTLQAVVCDGTVNNTGKWNGVIRKLELNVGRPLQWLICLLHGNELPFRKYFSVVDGGQTTGPKSCTGEIASALNFDARYIPIREYVAIPGKVVDVSDEVRKELSSDQLYLLKACMAVQQGYHASEHITFLQNAVPGNLSHARWLTKANRILRLYMSTETPSEPLRRLVNFILNVYAPSWFYIKLHCSCYEGAKNFFYMMQQCQQLEKSELDIVQPVLANNNYFAHPENILLAAIADNDESIRQFACEKIIAARKNATSNAVRIFEKTNIKLNFSASTYIDMIDWTKVHITPPPLLETISNEQLCFYKPASLKKLPCHSQAVERYVKDISASSSKVVGHESRHGMILQCQKSRKDIPVVASKADFLKE